MAKSPELKVLEQILEEMQFISRTLMVHFPTPPPGHGLPVPEHQQAPAGTVPLHSRSSRRRSPATPEWTPAMVLTSGSMSSFSANLAGAITQVVFGDDPPEPPAGVREPLIVPDGGGAGGASLAEPRAG